MISPAVNSLVSTHSRPKAAGIAGLMTNLGYLFQHTAARRRLGFRPSQYQALHGFNTQPPEGGWLLQLYYDTLGIKFQHTAARRRLGSGFGQIPRLLCKFQHTAARRRLAAFHLNLTHSLLFQHTAARRRLGRFCISSLVTGCFNTQPPEGGWLYKCRLKFDFASFQHTAARRRLA